MWRRCHEDLAGQPEGQLVERGSGNRRKKVGAELTCSLDGSSGVLRRLSCFATVNRSARLWFVNLHTHVAFGAFIATIFFGYPRAIILVMVGSLIPDMDREYWSHREVYPELQLHRSLLHNVFVILIAYLIEPLIALGIFLHSLLDSLTTVKDRGVEWFFPVSRAVSRGRYVYACRREGDRCKILSKPQDRPPEQNVIYYQEDPIELTQQSNPDLKEPKQVPWRRTYGPAFNGGIADNTMLLGSFASIALYSMLPGSVFIAAMIDYLTSHAVSIALFFILVASFFASGELGRRALDTERPEDSRSTYHKISILIFAIILVSAVFLFLTIGFDVHWDPLKTLIVISGLVFSLAACIVTLIVVSISKFKEGWEPYI
jgi:hypothetical protein